MIKICAPIKREEVKRVIKEALGDVEVLESEMNLKVMVDDVEKFALLKRNLKEDSITKVLYMSIKLE